MEADVCLVVLESESNQVLGSVWKHNISSLARIAGMLWAFIGLCRSAIVTVSGMPR